MAEVEAGSIKDSSKLNQNISPSSNLLDGLMFFYLFAILRLVLSQWLFILGASVYGAD